MITPADEGNANSGSVKFDGKKFSIKFMWKISLRVCYSVHDG